jgi:hypothetical protein
LVAYVKHFKTRPQNPEGVISAVEEVLKAPRRYGVFVRPWEVRAIAFVHALYRAEVKKKAAAAVKEKIASGETSTPG